LIDFGKIWKFLFFFNLAVLLVNFTGIFPESWNPYLKGIEESYNTIHEQLTNFSTISEQNILAQAGAMGFIAWIGIKLVLQLTLLAPYYVSVTLDNIFSSLGVPGVISYSIMLLTYMSFIFWIVDVFRGRSLSSD